MPEADFFSSKMSCCMAEQEERIEIDGWEIERSFPQQYFFFYEGENETYIEASVENSSSILYDKEIRNKPRTRRTKRNV